MKLIALTQGKFASVDDEDYDWLKQFKWSAQKKSLVNRVVYYAVRQTSRTNKKRQFLRMHREIAARADFPETDHIDGDGLNNQKHNLRPATHGQNQQNQHKRLKCASCYKGVNWDRHKSKWQVRLRLNGIRQHVGYFSDERLAAIAYNKAAIKAFGKFALINDIHPMNETQNADGKHIVVQNGQRVTGPTTQQEAETEAQRRNKVMESSGQPISEDKRAKVKVNIFG